MAAWARWAAETVEVHCNETADQVLLCDNGLEYVEYEPPLSPTDAPFWIAVGISIFLVLTAGMMSGLTIGLVSMDTTTLKVLIKSGPPKEKERARKLLPLVSRHHLLLVTLLLANAICMEALPIFLDRVVSPAAAIGISVTAVLFFGEIIPQALCTRFGLAIGANLSVVVWFVLIIFLPVSWPIAKLLDWLFGHSSGHYYRRKELVELINMHEVHTEENEEPLYADEIQIIRGALDLSRLTVLDAMTRLDRMIALSADAPITTGLVADVVAHGHSRLPVHEPGRLDHVVGILLAKSLLGVPTDGSLTVADLPLRPAHTVPASYSLFDMLHWFKTGQSHMAIVATEGGASIVGLTTLEDVVEALLREQIQDETDVDRMRQQMEKDDRAGVPRRSFPVGHTVPLAVPASGQTPTEASIPVAAPAAAGTASTKQSWWSFLGLTGRRRRADFPDSVKTSLLSVAPIYTEVNDDVASLDEERPLGPA